MRRIILTTANIDYLDVVKAWLMSMRLHSNNCFVRLDFINGNPDIHARLKKVYPNMEIVHYDIPRVADAQQNLLNLMFTRPPQMWKALNEDWDQICSMDCDALIRGSLEPLWADVVPGVFKILHKGMKKNAKTRLQGGVYVFGNSPEIKAYYKDVMDCMGEKFEFYGGQLALYMMLKKHSHLIKYVYLDKSFNDSKFRPTSTIWHSKHGQINNPVFLGYSRTCLMEANKYYNE